MDRDPIPQDEIEYETMKAFLQFEEGHHTESERLMLELIGKAGNDVDRYFSCLHYGELLMKMGRSEEAREVFTRSAQIALKRKEDRWLVLSHEKLGDLSSAEENWFGARHHYRYALRKAVALLDHHTMQELEAKSNAAESTLNSTVLSQDITVIPLNKEYLSGNMAISFAHRDIFVKKYFAHCLQCNFCHDWCCSFGADIDIQNVERIQQRREEILSFVRPPKGEWFDPEYTYYEEYVESEYTRIKTQGTRCVFLSKDQRGCGLHRYAVSKGIDYHEIKPLVCILFPLSFSEGILSLASELDDNSLICSGEGYSAYHSMRSELKYYFGSELVIELDGIEKEILLQR